MSRTSNMVGKKIIGLKQRLRAMVESSVVDGAGRPRAIREMFDHAVDKNICDPHDWFPGLSKALKKSEAQKIWSIGKLAERPVAKIRMTFQNLLMMGEVINGRGVKVWTMLPRSARYSPFYCGSDSEIVFYPFTALVVDAYLSMRSPKAWNTRDCTFDLRDQQWFEEKSLAYKNILNEFGSSALPGCFI